MDVHAPAGGVPPVGGGVGIVHEAPAPEAEQRAETTETTLSHRGSRLLGHLVDSGPSRWARAAIAWSHTRRALLLGTAVTALGGLVALVSLVVVGLAGTGTHMPSWYSKTLVDPSGVTNDASGGLYGPPYPPEVPQLSPQPPAIAGPIDAGFVLSQSLARLVLQPSDLPDGFTQLNAGPTGGDSTRGLLASYHAVYERLAPIIATDGTVSVFSLLGQYDTSEAASFHLRDLDISKLGADAGLPGATAALVESDTIGDESRAVHLTTAVANDGVGAYLIQFRRGSYEVVVGVVAPLGTESLDRALQLARIEASRLQSMTAPSG